MASLARGPEAHFGREAPQTFAGSVVRDDVRQQEGDVKPEKRLHVVAPAGANSSSEQRRRQEGER